MVIIIDINSLLVMVMGAVIAHYCIKWLDRRK